MPNEICSDDQDFLTAYFSKLPPWQKLGFLANAES
jgi:hypothetical protein